MKDNCRSSFQKKRLSLKALNLPDLEKWQIKLKDLGEKLYLNLNTKFKVRKIFKNATREANFGRTKNKNNIYLGEGVKIPRSKH